MSGKGGAQSGYGVSYANSSPDDAIPRIEDCDADRLCKVPLVSVVVVAYNQAAFIGEALSGILMQKVSGFSYEIVVGDDGSTDGTREVCMEFLRRYPDRIRILWWRENISRNGSFNYLRAARACRGRYVAFCDGDDYWTDPRKLQKQVDYLTAHPDCTICFHPVRVVWDDAREPASIFPANPIRFAAHEPRLKDLLRENFIQTNSVMYRWNADGRLFGDFPVYELPGDWMLNLLHARAGRIGFIDETMAVYRRSAKGLWTGVWRDERWFRRVGLRVMYFHESLRKKFNYGNAGSFRRLALATLGSLVSNPSSFEREKIVRVIDLAHPTKGWILISPVLAWMYGIMCRLCPPSMRPAIEVRRDVWRIVARHRKEMRDALRHHR